VSGYNGVGLGNVRNRETARMWNEKQGGYYKYRLVKPQTRRLETFNP